MSINVYGLDKKFQPPRKYPTYEVYPLRVVDEEKKDHFDLLLVTDGDNSHYTNISNFSRLIRKQKTAHTERLVFCKRCFTSFDGRRHKYKLSGQEALKQHRRICGEHKPILPVMPEEGSILEFEGWSKTQRHPIVIYADFEAILMKTDEKKGKSTTIIHKHKPMSYGVYVKATENVPSELLEEHDIPTSVIIHRGSETHTEVAKHFVETVVDLSRKIENLLKTNRTIKMSEEQQDEYNRSTTCNLCKKEYTILNRKVRDHCHLSGQYRQTICNSCNLTL